MTLRVGTRGLPVALVSAIVLTVLVAGVEVSDPASAQTAAPSGGAPILTIRAPSYTAGNTTLTGIAVDCRTGAPATRVAIYDGPDVTFPYVADVSMDTLRPIGAFCPGRAGAARIGFTLIYNTRFLSEGTHQLLFNAEFPDGTTTSSILAVYIENNPPYQPACRDPNCGLSDM